MRIPVIKGVIDRRILVNYRVDPDVLSKVLPAPFRPLVHDGHGIAGICLIRLRDVRPAFVPFNFGIGSENAAHRIAVEWDTPNGTASGVYIPRRDTSSRLNVCAGGRLFPGMHHHARFTSAENGNDYRVTMASDDGKARVDVTGAVAEALPSDSVFESIACASAFFEKGALGYSATAQRGLFDGLELRTMSWNVTPLDVSDARSSFFENESMFARGSVQFDCALLMRNIQHEWHGRESLCCSAA